LRAARLMLAGRPHEAASNGSPRWMAVGPLRRVHRTRSTGRLAPRLRVRPALAAPSPGAGRAGFQVIVPDLRGYGRSGNPGAVEAYSISTSLLAVTSWRSWPGSGSPRLMWAMTGGRAGLGARLPSRPEPPAPDRASSRCRPARQGGWSGHVCGGICGRRVHIRRAPVGGVGITLWTSRAPDVSHGRYLGGDSPHPVHSAQ
jgi:hypothetical protein